MNTTEHPAALPPVTVRHFAAARAAAGVDHETAVAATVAELRSVLAARHGDQFARVLSASSLLLDGEVARDDHRSLAGVREVDVLPPFAGG